MKQFKAIYATQQRGKFFTKKIQAKNIEDAWHKAAYNWEGNRYGRQGIPAPLIELTEWEA